jgi:hypothetical protein
MLIPIVIWGVLVPALAAGTTMLLAFRPWSGDGAPAGVRDAWGAGLALAIGYVVGHAGLPGAPWIGSPDIGRVIPLYAAIGAVLGGLTIHLRLPTLVTWMLRAVIGGSYGWLLVGPRLEGGLEVSSGWLFIAAVTGAVVLNWWSIDRAARDEPGPGLAVGLLVWGTGGSVVLVMSGTALAGQLSGILLAAVGGLLVVIWRFPSNGCLRSAAGVVSLTLVGQWAFALLYASMSWPVFLTLGVASLALLVGRLSWLRERSGSVRLLLRSLAVIGAISIPAGLAARSYFDHGDGDGYGSTSAGEAGATSSESETDEQEYGY